MIMKKKKQNNKATFVNVYVNNNKNTDQEFPLDLSVNAQK